MIKFVVARHNEDDSDIIKNYLNKSIDRTKDHIMEIWHGNSIFEKYNKGIDAWLDDIESPLQDDDIICFMHEDIRIFDTDFHTKVDYVFKNRKKVGVLGVIGTKVFQESGGWWLTDQSHLTGHILQNAPDLPHHYHMIKKIEYTEQTVSVDGCCFFVRGSLAKDIRFDDTTFGGYHFYDCDYCFSVLEKGYNIAVADILIEHLSEGPLNDDWYRNKDLFINKWKSKGKTFPITRKSFN